jgi:hypothetical protein
MSAAMLRVVALVLVLDLLPEHQFAFHATSSNQKAGNIDARAHLEHFPAKWNLVHQKKMLPINQ